GWTLARGVRRNAFPMLAMGLFGAVLPFITGIDWMLGGRMVVPYLPFLACTTAIGWFQLTSRLTRLHATAGIAMALLLIAAAWFLQGSVREGFREHHAYRGRGYASGHTALADWLHRTAKPGDTVALMDIGIVGYKCPDVRILDISGLTDRFIAKSRGVFLSKQ